MRFHLNGHTIGFRLQTQKLELHYMSPLLTLGVQGNFLQTASFACGLKTNVSSLGLPRALLKHRLEVNTLLIKDSGEKHFSSITLHKKRFVNISQKKGLNGIFLESSNSVQLNLYDSGLCYKGYCTWVRLLKTAVS